MNTEEKDGILSTVLDVPTALKYVQMAPKNKLEKMLIAFKIKAPVYEMLYLKGLKLSTNYRLTAITNALYLKSGKSGEMDKIMDLLHENTYQMAGYLATAIHNHNSETPGWLIQTIADELTNQELKIATDEVYRRLDIQSFFGSMELVRSLSLM